MEEKCLFTGKGLIELEKDNKRDCWKFDSKLCEKYYLLNPLHFAGKKFPNVQQLLRCASLNLKFVEDGFATYWVPDHLYQSKQVNDLRLMLEKSNEKYKIFNFEREYNTPVRQEEKPILLLKAMSEKATTGYDFIVINEKDFLKAMLRIEECAIILTYLQEEKLLFSFQMMGTQAHVKISPKGWALIKEKYIEKSNKVFVAMAFNWKEKEKNQSMKKSAAIEEQQFLNAIYEACAELGYDASPVSQEHNGNFVYKILNEIEHCAFVIADFTYDNNGVYFESGYARAKGKEVFHLVKADHVINVHSDIKQIQYLDWDDDFVALRENLKAKIEVIVGKYNSGI